MFNIGAVYSSTQLINGDGGSDDGSRGNGTTILSDGDHRKNQKQCSDEILPRHIVRFTPIATHWRAKRATFMSQFGDEMEAQSSCPVGWHEAWRGSGHH
jgi:hypothetical protein